MGVLTKKKKVSEWRRVVAVVVLSSTLSQLKSLPQGLTVKAKFTDAVAFCAAFSRIELNANAKMVRPG